MNRCSQCNGEIAGSGTTCDRCDSLGAVPLSLDDNDDAFTLDSNDAFNFDDFIAESTAAAASPPATSLSVASVVPTRPAVVAPTPASAPASAAFTPEAPLSLGEDELTFDDFVPESPAAPSPAPATARIALSVAPPPPVAAGAPEVAPEAAAFATEAPLSLGEDELTFDDFVPEPPAAPSPAPATARIALSVAPTPPPITAAAAEVAEFASEDPMSLDNLDNDDSLTFDDFIPESPAAAASTPATAAFAPFAAPAAPPVAAAVPAAAPSVAAMPLAAAEVAPAMPIPPVAAPAAARGANRRMLLAALLVLGGGTLTFAMFRSTATPAAPVTTSNATASKPAASKASAPKPMAPQASPAAMTATAPPAPVTGPRWTAANSEWLLNTRKGVAFQLPALKKVTIWQGVAQPMLVLRCDAGRMQMFVYTASAIRMEPEDQNHTVRVSVDGEKEAIERWADSSDHDALFVPDATAMARRLTTASTLRIGYTPHNAQPVVAEFQVGGFSEVLGPAAKPCGWK